MGPKDTNEATSETTNDQTPTPRAVTRRRASRAAGPATDEVGPAPTTITLDKRPVAKPKVVKSVGPPPRRLPNRQLVAVVGLVVTAALVIALAITMVLAARSHRAADAEAARDRRFVDTASQTVVNMFSYTQNTIDESVNRFVGGISGPLRDMMSQGDNVDNLKAIFRDTQANSEAVINGAALEKFDPIANNASVLVAVRVTVTDIDGVNSPSKPYRLRVIVHEDDNGTMTGYDLKYPDGGN